MRSLKRLMKSDREVREICKRETDAYLRENYEQIAKQAAYQTIAFENLKEEVADVLIMAEQMRQYIGAETVDQIINQKLKRQLDRIMTEGRTKT